MVNNLEELSDLLRENEMTLTDITFIVNFMKQESISPQLAMRRIKAFDSIKEKLDDNTDKVKLQEQEEELNSVKNQLLEKSQEIDQLQDLKTGLESQKQELESKSELQDSERDELQRQLEMLKDVKFDEDFEDDQSEPLLSELRDQLSQVRDKSGELKAIFQPLIDQITLIIQNEGRTFDLEGYMATVEDQMKTLRDSATGTKTQNQMKTSYEPTSNLKKTQESPSRVENKTKIPQKTENKSEKKVSAKEEQVLNLFIEFVQESDDDKSFKDRVATVCDMDEAYQYLGSIGLSQVYSYGSRGIEKKTELLELLNSWKKEGIPR